MTDHRSAEATLREVLENAQGASYKRNLLTNAYEYLSPIFTKLTGRTVEEVKAMPLEEILKLIHPEDTQEIQAEVMAALQDAQNGHSRVDYRFRHLEGHYIWLRDEFKVIFGDNGEPLALVGCVSDITAGKAIEKELHESRASLEALIESTSDLIWSVDRNYALTSFNVALANHLLSAYGTHARKGLVPDDLLPSARAAVLASLYERTSKEGPFRQDLALEDGRVLELNLQPIRHGDSVVGTSVFGKDVTEGRRAELALHGSVAQVQALLRAIPDLIFLNSREGEYLDFRAYDAELLLVPPEAFLHKTVTEVLPRPLADRFMATMARALDLNEIQVMQYDLAISGTARWFEARLVPCGADQVVTISRDITERIQAVSALQKEKDKYLGLFEHMHSGFILMEVILDPAGAPVDHRLLEANAEFETQTGLKRGQEIGRTSAELSFQWPPEVAQSFYKVALGGSPIAYERFNESLQRHYDVRVFSPSPRHWGMLFHDITERKQAEQSLRASEEKFAKVFRSAPILVALSRLEDGKLIEVNDQFCLALGFTEEELLGRTTGDLGIFRPEDREPLVQVIRDKGAFRSVEFDMHAKNGQAIPCLFSAELIEVGGEALILSMLTDITRLRQAERDQHQLKAEVEQMQKMESLGRLAGGVAHDMNNVLGAILALASAHLVIQPEENSAYPAFETIRDAATRGGEMVKRLLTFARRNPIENRELDLNALLLEEVRLLERTTLAKVHLELDLAPDLLAIHGDGSALAHAFMNLCVNAVDAMGEGGTLTFRTRNLPDHRVEVVVADTGCGMTQDVVAKAMEPYFTTKGVGRGTGLGLSLVHTTVKAHDGHIGLLSEPGRGTAVTLTFPAHAAKGPGPEPRPHAESTCPDTALGVLLVDDDPLIQASTRMLLEVLGHAVTVVASGEEALELVETGLRPQVVILDMNMPGLGGKGTLPQLRLLCPTVPVILATGRTDQEALDLVAAYPSVTLMSKPFSFEELRGHLHQVGGDGSSGQGSR